MQVNLKNIQSVWGNPLINMVSAIKSLGGKYEISKYGKFGKN